MKRIVILFVVLVLVNVLIASSVSYEQALKTAEHQISVHEKMGYTISEYFEIKDSNSRFKMKAWLIEGFLFMLTFIF